MGELDVYKLNFFDFLEAEDGQLESSSAEVTCASALIFEICTTTFGLSVMRSLKKAEFCQSHLSGCIFKDGNIRNLGRF